MSTSATGRITGYILGKVEGRGTDFHGHVTAISVAPSARRLRLAHRLMDHLEHVSQEVYNAYFVDLFVRVSNYIAIGMYENMGYKTYRRVVGYYSDTGEYALDMRKSLKRDPEKLAMVPLGRDAYPDECVF